MNTHALYPHALYQSLQHYEHGRHNAVLQFTVNLKGKFPKGLCAYVQPHTFEPDNIVLDEWEIAHTEFHKELLAVLIRHYEKKVQTERQPTAYNLRVCC